MVVAVGQDSASPVWGAVLAPDELPPEELLPLEDVAPEELLLDDPPLEPPELDELLELLELLEEDPPLLLDEPAAPGPATTL